MTLRADSVSFAYGDRQVLRALDCELAEGRITAIVGANASGKSTLLRAMARLIAPQSGSVLLDGTPIGRLPTREVARRVGFLPQSPSAPEGLTVGDLVARGRYPHQRLGRPPSAHDRARIDWALEATGTAALRERPLDQLSGGQRQRVWIAMVLAQDTGVLLLDEPTTYLDLAHQLEVLDLLADLNERDGRTIALVLHDLNQACRYAHVLVAMRAGAVYAAGPPREIVDATLVHDVLSLRADVIDDPVTGAPLCIPLGRAARAAPGAAAVEAVAAPVVPAASAI
jgi:iron complex transport system ATP-binding protein